MLQQVFRMHRRCAEKMTELTRIQVSFRCVRRFAISLSVQILEHTFKQWFWVQDEEDEIDGMIGELQSELVELQQNILADNKLARYLGNANACKPDPLFVIIAYSKDICVLHKHYLTFITTINQFINQSLAVKYSVCKSDEILWWFVCLWQ